MRSFVKGKTGMVMSNKKSKEVWYFFFFTLLWTWGFGFLPLLFNLTGTSLGTFLFYFGGGAPSVIGLFFVLRTYSAEEKRDYFYRCFSLRLMGYRCVIGLICFFTLIALIGVSVGVKILHAPLPEMAFVKLIMEKPWLFPFIIIISILSGPLNEEFGWRGYALDKLLDKYGFYGASLILGFIWAIWHLPWYFMPGQAQYDLLKSSVWEAFLFIPSTILLSFVVSFVYLYTERSILAGAMTHMLSNLMTSQLLAPYSTETGTVIRYVEMLFCIVVIIYAMASKKFNKNLQIQMDKIRGNCAGRTGS